MKYALSYVSKLNKNLLGVLLSDQHCKKVRVLRTFARNLCESALVNLAPTTSVTAGSVGASLPARPAAGFLAFTDRTASTHPRLQRLVAASGPNSTTESVQMTPTEAASTMLVRAVFHEESKPQVLREHVRRIVFSCNFHHLDTPLSNQVLKPKKRNIDVPDLAKPVH